MNICFFGDAGNIHLRQLTARLAGRGHTVCVVCHKPAEIPGVSVETYRVPRVGLTRPHRYRGRCERYVRSFFTRFDVVVHFFLHDWGFTPEMPANGCYVAFPQGSDIVPPPGEYPPTPRLLRLRREWLRQANLVGTTCRRFAQITASFAGLDTDDIGSLPLGVDVRRFSSAGAKATSGEVDRRVGYFKGFRAVYGPMVLMQAIPHVMEQCPDARFDLVGGGPQRDRCRAYARRVGIDHAVRWIDTQPHEKIPALLSTWALSVIPSICESFGVAAIESAAAGVPVVASNVGGLPDAVVNGSTGLLVPPDNAEALAGSIVELLRDPTRRQQMGTAGRRRVVKRFTWPVVLDQWENTLQTALDRAYVMC